MATTQTYNTSLINTSNPAFTYNAEKVNELDPNARVTAEQWTPDSNSLVENRLTGLLNQDNPYMQAARDSGLATAQSRGLLNSSIAAGSSQQAAIKAALPIASQDATTYANAGMTNRDAVNQANQFNAGTFNQRSLTNAGFVNDAARANTGIQANLATTNSSFENDAGKFNAGEANTSARLADELASRAQIARENTAASQAMASAQIGSAQAMANAQIQSATVQANAARETTMLTNMGSTLANSMQLNNSAINAIAISVTSAVYGMNVNDILGGTFGVGA